MGMEDGSIEWFSPQQRGIIPLDSFHIPHGLRRTLKKAPFEVRVDTMFDRVIRACAERSETWITRAIVESYTKLHELGYAHSVEAFAENKLVGGLYGVAIGGAFFGESMFHNETDASKVALCALVDRLRARRFALLDTQWLTPHLEQFGTIQITRRQYMHLLTRAVALVREF